MRGRFRHDSPLTGKLPGAFERQLLAGYSRLSALWCKALQSASRGGWRQQFTCYADPVMHRGVPVRRYLFGPKP